MGGWCDKDRGGLAVLEDLICFYLDGVVEELPKDLNLRRQSCKVLNLLNTLFQYFVKDLRIWKNNT